MPTLQGRVIGYRLCNLNKRIYHVGVLPKTMKDKIDINTSLHFVVNKEVLYYIGDSEPTYKLFNRGDTVTFSYKNTCVLYSEEPDPRFFFLTDIKISSGPSKKKIDIYSGIPDIRTQRVTKCNAYSELSKAPGWQPFVLFKSKKKLSALCLCLGRTDFSTIYDGIKNKSECLLLFTNGNTINTTINLCDTNILFDSYCDTERNLEKRMFGIYKVITRTRESIILDVISEPCTDIDGKRMDRYTGLINIRGNRIKWGKHSNKPTESRMLFLKDLYLMTRDRCASRPEISTCVGVGKDTVYRFQKRLFE